MTAYIVGKYLCLEELFNNAITETNAGLDFKTSTYDYDTAMQLDDKAATPAEKAVVVLQVFLRGDRLGPEDPDASRHGGLHHDGQAVPVQALLAALHQQSIVFVRLEIGAGEGLVSQSDGLAG